MKTTLKEEREKRYLVERCAAIKGLALADIEQMAENQIRESLLPSKERYCLEAIRHEARRALEETENVIRASKASGK